MFGFLFKNYNDWEREYIKSTALIQHFNYNNWEKLGGKTTTNGIPMVGGSYNGCEMMDRIIRWGKYVFGGMGRKYLGFTDETRQEITYK